MDGQARQRRIAKTLAREERLIHAASDHAYRMARSLMKITRDDDELANALGAASAIVMGLTLGAKARPKWHRALRVITTEARRIGRDIQNGSAPPAGAAAPAEGGSDG